MFKKAKAPDAQLAEQIPRLKAFLRKLSPGDEEDLLQEVMARALKYGHAFQAEGSLSGWLMKTGFRVFLDSRAREKKTAAPMGDKVWDIPAPPENGSDLREVVEELLHGLEEKDRDLLRRFHCEGESIERIAKAYGMPEGTVKSRLHRARRKLARKKMEEE
jgi:RNA polymerase sigma-70 factor (ECF subfamily)